MFYTGSMGPQLEKGATPASRVGEENHEQTAWDRRPLGADLGPARPLVPAARFWNSARRLGTTREPSAMPSLSVASERAPMTPSTTPSAARLRGSRIALAAVEVGASVSW